MKKKVLMVLGSMNNGGTEAFVMNYYRTLDRNKYDVDFLVFTGLEDYFEQEIISKGDTIFHLSREKSNPFIRNMLLCYKQMKKLQYDIVHIHSCSLKFMIQAILPSKLTGNKTIIAHAHSVGEPTGGFFDTAVRKVLMYMISSAVSIGASCSLDSAENKFTKRLIESDRFVIIPNAIDTRKYLFNIESRNKVRNQFSIDKDSIVIGLVGRLEKWKNQTFLIDILPKLRKKADYCLLFVGDGDIYNDLKKQSQDLGVEESVIFAGMVSNAYEFYSAFDLFCLPSYGEGFPFVLVEAQANGLKCMASDDMTRETNISTLVKYISIQSKDAWAKDIFELEPERMEKKFVDKVIQQYDIANASKKLEQIYDSLGEVKI